MSARKTLKLMLNVIDRNAYLILGSVETLRYNPEAYLSWLNGMIDILTFLIQRKEVQHFLQKWNVYYDTKHSDIPGGFAQL